MITTIRSRPLRGLLSAGHTRITRNVREKTRNVREKTRSVDIFAAGVLAAAGI